jgi:hypothetical protein
MRDDRHSGAGRTSALQEVGAPWFHWQMRSNAGYSRLTSTLATLAFAATLLVACQQASPPSPTTKPAVPATAPSATERPAQVVAPGVVLPSLDFPPGPLYFCETKGARAAIDYEPRVDQLCRRHPEMGPCQYERDACRAQGGRVITARGEEVTLAVEAEYDRVVRRVRFQADGAPARR